GAGAGLAAGWDRASGAGTGAGKGEGPRSDTQPPRSAAIPVKITRLCMAPFRCHERSPAELGMLAQDDPVGP
ncbi:MAG TPA: hypothetical protein VKA43_05410, partial [Gammaproteobacteria bacterium]|nr:hypothetical protein [Gammaproteobacteria bacterium]